MLTRSIISPLNKPELLVGELSDDDTCCLAGTIASDRTPILLACREVLARGASPDAAVEIYRRGVLALRIRTLAAGASVTSRSVVMAAQDSDYLGRGLRRGPQGLHKTA
jgi:hypothetical protein